MSYLEQDGLRAIDKRLADKRYLLGEERTQADTLLYQTLLRHDHIYYYLYKLNFAKSYDFENIRRYLKELDNIEEVRESIDIVEEKNAAFKALDEDRNPYQIVFKGPQREIP